MNNSEILDGIVNRICIAGKHKDYLETGTKSNPNNFITTIQAMSFVKDAISLTEQKLLKDEIEFLKVIFSGIQKTKNTRKYNLLKQRISELQSKINNHSQETKLALGRVSMRSSTLCPDSSPDTTQIKSNGGQNGK